VTKKPIKMDELVSIITPSFNSEKFISETILSVQRQSYTNWEMIIVDDFSTDKTVEIIRKFTSKDNRIKLFELDKNSGTGIARGCALNKAAGKYIAFLDADDLWKSEKLKIQIDFLKTNHQFFTFSFYDCMDENGKSLYKTITAPKNLTYSQLLFCNFVGNLTGIYDASYFGKIPISVIRKRQDWMLWLTILKKIKTAKPIPESLAIYRIRKDSISASKIDLFKHNFLVYRQFHRFNIVFSVFSMIVFLITQLFVKPFYVRKSF
jgi:glycosyltransferase involved in cell wall biosynthesis